MRVILTAFIITVLGSGMTSQDCNLQLKGRVIDRATYEPLEFASIGIQEELKGTYSDSNGFFSITGVCAGDYHIHVDHLGCSPGRYFLSLQSDTFLNIYLDHHTELLREIIVEGKPDHLSESQSQQSISAGVIKENAGKSLSEITELVSGVRSLRNGTGINKPVIHGLFGNRITVINNGLSQAGQQWGADHAPEIDPNTATLITVVKGADAIEYGSQAMGGAVIIDAGPIVRDPHIHGTVGYALNLNGLGHTLYSRISKSHQKIDWRLTGSVKKAGDQKAPDYFLTNTGVNEANGSIQFIYRLNQRTQHQLYYSLFTTTLGVFAGSHISNLTDLQQAIGRKIPFRVSDSFSYVIDEPRQKVEHHLLKYSGKTFIRDDIFIEWIYGLQNNHRREFDIRRGDRSEIPALDLRLWSHTLEAKYFNHSGKLKYKTGVQAKLNDNTNDFDTGILPLIPDYRELSTALFIQSQLPVGKFTIEAGGRYDLQILDVWAITNTLPREIIKRDHVYHDFSLALGFFIKPSDAFETRFNNVLAKRSPEVNELYSNGLHQGIAGIEEGDWTLNAETAIKSILTQSIVFHEALHLELTAHSNLIYQYIYLKPEDELRLTIRGAFPVYTYSQEDAWLRGIDVALVSDFSHTLEWASKLSFMKGTSLDDHDPISLIPPLYATSTLSWSINDSRQWKGTKLSFGAAYTARQNDWNEDEELLEPPASYFLLAAGFETALQLKANKLHIGLHVDNVLNERYRDYLNRLRYFADEAGRSLRLNLRYEF